MKRNQLEQPVTKNNPSPILLAKQVRETGQELDRLLDDVLYHLKD
ncbi:hypothetical protein [Lacimicrobium alkaliphilum]|nr:hypothetical protein [Lacimicrobium alkaliphilum]